MIKFSPLLIRSIRSIVNFNGSLPTYIFSDFSKNEIINGILSFSTLSHFSINVLRRCVSSERYFDLIISGLLIFHSSRTEQIDILITSFKSCSVKLISLSCEQVFSQKTCMHLWIIMPLSMRDKPNDGGCISFAPNRCIAKALKGHEA